ncbi:hypothetical protein B296_00058558 [Ensete ventricosum]|uniref:Uncharacterized protein n=1 Tax=Ensete ventricosum TaxID=4639 RepID=A0A426XLM8_ENSVE|nr:hypothetical protein B296_00058558 [Ensete ventricosum]
MIRVAKELDYFITHIRFRELGKLKDKVECKATDSSVMNITAPWYHKGGTSLKSSISCSYGGRALAVKGAEKVENAKANSKYQNKTEGQRPGNFVRPVSTSFSSR